MTTAFTPILQVNDVRRTVADLLSRLGDIPAERVLMLPLPGTATEHDLLDLVERQNRPSELIDGTVVGKPLGTVGSFLASILNRLLGNFVAEKRLGLISGESGLYRLRVGLVRVPDVAFVAWSRLPSSAADLPAIAPVVPNLVVEVLSESNTVREMAMKLKEYFAAGVELVWILDPDTRTLVVHTAPAQPDRVLAIGDTIDGGTILPGFELKLADLFAQLENPFGPPAADGQRA
jgi:Uma2 family endonuclease